MTKTLLASIFALALLAPASALAANPDPEWPCVQRKVPSLSIGQVWNGPPLPEAARDWEKDKPVSALVDEVSARRMPLEEAQKKIGDFAASLPPDTEKATLEMLAQGLFDHMDAERSHVMAGITRYAHKQIAMAAELRKERSALDTLMAKADADPDDVERQTDALNFATRIYDERAQSMSSVSEVPTYIEHRLEQLAKSGHQALR
jgi:DNA-directed RNA polymerase alpha subunit